MTQNDLVLHVSGTDIALQHAPGEITAGSLYANVCYFAFDSAWDAFGGRVAFFGTARDAIVPMPLTLEENDGYSCSIPASVLHRLNGGGKLYISVSGAAYEGERMLRTKLYHLYVADSGETSLFLTPEERDTFLADSARALAHLEAIAVSCEGRAIHSAVINQNHELVLSMEDGTVFNLGNVRGPQGIQGQTGAKGDTGEKGEKGDTGARGEKGDTGEKGEKGDTGEKGEKGDTGEQGMSIIGPQGPRGQTGAKGDTGVGIRSISLLQNGDLSITLTDGSVCEPGNIKGPAGATGATGPQGPQGDPGADGYFSVSDNGVDYKVELQLIDGAPCLVCTELESEEENDA